MDGGQTVVTLTARDQASLAFGQGSMAHNNEYLDGRRPWCGVVSVAGLVGESVVQDDADGLAFSVDSK